MEAPPPDQRTSTDVALDERGEESIGLLGAVDIEDVLETPLWRIRLKLGLSRFYDNWKLFAENKIGLLGLGIIVVFIVMALAHPILMSTVWDARTYDPVLGYSAPRVDMEVVASADDVVDSTRQISLQRARLQSGARGMGVEVGEILSIPQQPARPVWPDHPLGTDPLGRDVLSQLLFSTRAAFAMAAIAALSTAIFATLAGAAAAYFGGWIDNTIMRVADLLLLLPILALLIFIAGMYNVTLPVLGLLIGVASGFGGTAIVLKSQALAVKVKPFIDAARIAGGGHWRIITRHIVPNILPLAFLYMMFTVTAAIGLEATLSFFGLIDVAMSWGIMIHTAQTRGYLLRGTEYWWLLIPAGVAVSLLAAAFYFVGRALDEVINPRLRQR